MSPLHVTSALWNIGVRLLCPPSALHGFRVVNYEARRGRSNVNKTVWATRSKRGVSQMVTTSTWVEQKQRKACGCMHTRRLRWRLAFVWNGLHRGGTTQSWTQTRALPTNEKREQETGDIVNCVTSNICVQDKTAIHSYLLCLPCSSHEPVPNLERVASQAGRRKVSR